MVVRGADASLLDTYDAERRPVIAATLAQALARLQQWFKDPAGRLPPAVPIVDDYDVVFGQRYDAGAFVPEGTPPDRPFEPLAALSGRPGTRAPHVTVERNRKRISILDLFGRDFVLLAGEAHWCRAATAVGERRGLPLTCHVVGPGDDVREPEGRWPAAYGIGTRGAVLVRPDGFVASRWPDDGNDAESTLNEALERLALGKTGKDRRAP
jgi:hypothetical protein